VIAGELTPELKFREAFEMWLGRRVIEGASVGERMRKVKYISDRTERDLRQYARAAARFFDELTLAEIHAGHIREFQRARATNRLIVEDGGGRQIVKNPWDHPAGANLILKEVQLVIRIMRAAGAWSDVLDEMVELVSPDEADVRRALTPEEQRRWIAAAGSREAWRVVYWCSIVALQTTAATNEMRALRLGDIFLNQGTLQIRSEGAKNRFRIRTIPLQTQEVTWALGALIDRAKMLGASGPHCYLFPFHITSDHYDALRPMTVSGLRRAWDEVRAASGIDWLTPYGLRHSAITRMAEAGVPIQVIMSFAGHIRPAMQQHYTQISMQSKRRWAAAAWMNAEAPSYAPGVASLAPGVGIPMPIAAPAGSFNGVAPRAALAGGEAGDAPEARPARRRRGATAVR